MMGRRKFIGLSLLTFLSACSLSGNSSRDAFDLSPTISAAASLQDALQEIGKLYNQQHNHVQIIYNFGSSGSLRYQIEQGAPVDIFISADEQYMDSLDNKNLLLKDTRQNLLKNEVVLITAQGNNIDGFSELKKDIVSKIAIGDPESVPAGKYAKEVLDFLKLYKLLESRFVFAKNVRQVLAYVETGNVEAGIVYRTDAQISKRVKVIATAPIDSHSPIIYPVAIARDSKNPKAAQDFIQFLLSNTAKNIFSSYGFKF